nr:uncharacterized mitochondrial protein AtMg00810-like [Tanacetum cinerariifolium]
MKDTYALPRGTLPPVVIREHELRKYQPLQEVPIKGKAKVTDDQVVLGAEEGGQDKGQARPNPDAQAEDQTGSDASAQAEDQMGSDAGAQAEGHARSNPDQTSEGQARSNPDETSEGQAGPDLGDAEDKVQSITSPVVHTGSDREHMDLDVADVSPKPSMEQLDEGFTATAYPKVQKNLKLAIKESVDKPSEADKNAETKVESMVNVLIQQALSSISLQTSPIIDLSLRPESPKAHQQFKATITDTTTTTTLPPPQAPQQSTTEAMMVKRIGKLEHIMADLIQVNKDMEERLDSHGSRLFILEQTDIPQQVSIAVSEVVTNAVDWAMQASLRNRFRDLPEADTKEILHQRMWESDSYKSHDDHMHLFEALEKSMNSDHSEELAQDLAEARKKKEKSRDSPKTPPGSPSHKPPPPPPPTGPSGASGAPGDSGSAQVPPSPPLPSSTNQESPSKGFVAPSPSKTAASAEYQAWTMTDIRLRPSILLTPTDLEMDEDMAPDEHAQSSDDEDIGSAHIPTTRQLVIRQRVEDFQLGIESYQTHLNLTKPHWDATGYDYKHDYTVIDSVRAAIFRDKYGVQMMMRVNEIHKSSDGTLQQINEALDYKIKKFRINRMNPGLNTRFWTRKDVDQSKAFMFTIQWRLKTRRIFCSLESFGNDLLIGNRGSDLYIISLQESTSSTPLCLMAKATPTQAWLWHQSLSYLSFDYINLLLKKDIVIGLPKLKYVKDQLCSFCEVSKAKRSSFKSKAVPSSKGRLNLLHMDLCGPMQTLNAFFKEEGIEHQTSTARTPEQNGVVERRNRTLVEVARTMLSASQLPLFFWAEAIATACYTQNRSIIIPTHDKTPYHIINDQKPSIKHLYIFGCICYITRDGKNLDKMKEKGDQCILVGYSTYSKGYHVYNKRTRMIVESIHIFFDEIKEVSKMSVANNTSGLVPQRQKASNYDNPNPVPQRQDVFSLADADVPSQQELDILFDPLKTTMIKQKKENTYKMMNLPILSVHQHKKKLSLPHTTLEAMADFAWIETIQVELHQFDRLQAKYTLEILHKHGMDKGQSIGTPMATKPKLDVNLSGNPVDQTDYRSKIGSLMYLTSSRSDIVQVVCFWARYQSRPTEKHLKEVKRIFRYLRGTVNMGLWYPKDSSFELTAFLDANHVRCIDSHKSTSGGIQFLGDKLVSWISKKQNCTGTSSAKAEYVALSASCAQVMWMRTQLQDYGYNYNKIPLYCDSQSAIAISCNPVQHSRTKHIHTRYHFIKKQVENDGNPSRAIIKQALGRHKTTRWQRRSRQKDKDLKISDEKMKSKDNHKSDRMLTDVRTTLDDRLKRIRMQYLPQSIWRKSDKERATTMIQAIDKRLKTRRIMRSLERFVGGRLYEGDFRMLQRTI